MVYGHEKTESYGYSAGLSLPRHETLVNISPFFLREVGGEQLTVTSPCIKTDTGEGTSVYCRFLANNNEPIDVEGTFSGANTVMCVSPIFPVVGFVKFELSIDNKKTFPFRGNFYVAPQHVLPPKLSVKQTSSPNEDFINATKSDNIISLRWNQDDFPNAETLDVSAMFVTMDQNGDNQGWSEEVAIINDVFNSGTAIVRSKDVSDAANMTSMEGLSVKMVVFSVKRSPSRERRLLGPEIGFSVRSPITILITQAVLPTQCFRWYALLKIPNDSDLPPCPCTSDQARSDRGNFEKDENPSLSSFHPGASICYRSINNGFLGQQCCYGSDGNILVGPPGGGTADAIAPDGASFSTLAHFVIDVVPFYACCRWSNNCDTYYAFRPSHDCTDYDPPTSTRGTGDPHFISLDGNKFTFNGAGEFLLFKSSLFNVTFQTRMEVIPGTNASVHSAFVLTSNSSDQIQIQRSSSNETLVLIDGSPINLRQDGVIIRKQVHRGLHLSLKTDMSEIYIRQQSGLSLSIRITDEMMSFILQLPDIFQNQVQGLLGNFNNDPDDDFMLPDGSFLSPNLTLEEIHYDFGLSCMLNATSSLFTYLPPNDFSTFNHPSFKPTMTFPDPDQVSNDIKGICGESNLCMFDAVSTGSTKFANDTLHDINTFDIIKNHSVKLITCGFPGRVSNGVFNGSVYLVGHRLSISCKEGFYLIGPADLVCSENGTWSSILPACSPCANPSTTSNFVDYAKAVSCVAWHYMWWDLGF
ncbi:Sushi domain-containing protein 2 [Holothuria leucospilota]|uniref:Sushi domain-containing protein 2 n=1 Tax=Holothuria leucospilota TaxID=206669 RepID=A0A9Q1H7K4_HOLLE|nr:Sushi domain-containing protein 2 [Holothuria leucospilota]